MSAQISLVQYIAVAAWNTMILSAHAAAFYVLVYPRAAASRTFSGWDTFHAPAQDAIAASVALSGAIELRVASGLWLSGLYTRYVATYALPTSFYVTGLATMAAADVVQVALASVSDALTSGGQAVLCIWGSFHLFLVSMLLIFHVQRTFAWRGSTAALKTNDVVLHVNASTASTRSTIAASTFTAGRTTRAALAV